MFYYLTMNTKLCRTLYVNINCLCKSYLNHVLPSSRRAGTVTNFQLDLHRKSPLSNSQEQTENDETLVAPRHYKYVFPEFLPDPTINKRDRIAEKLERRDMLKRRSVIDIPEFYVGSIMAVTIADQNATAKKNRFVGLCIGRDKHGLRANFTLRNVIDGQGVEIVYDIYSPIIQSIEVLKLEKRLDEHLFYLRDAPLEYSTVPFNHEAVPHPSGAPVPINPIKVPLNPYPWTTRWELYDFKGADMTNSGIWPKRIIRAQHPLNIKAWQKYDLMKWYRESINDVETEDIMDSVYTGMREIKEKKTQSKKKR